MPISRRTVLVAAAGVVTPAIAELEPPASAPESVAPSDLVTVHRGTLPIIISAPHGGGAKPAGGVTRTKQNQAAGQSQFVTVMDTGTAELASLLAVILTRALGAKPHLVVADFHRRYADPNRAPDLASQDAVGAHQYAAFHKALRAGVNDIRAAHGRGLLLDIHGQKREPNAIVRGTRNGETVRALLKTHGDEALTGPKSILGTLAAAGDRILPPNDGPQEPLAREALFDGGYIVSEYGSHNPLGIDAIQLEFGTAFRAPERLVKTARDLATAVCFARTYLGLAELPPSDEENRIDP